MSNGLNPQTENENECRVYTDTKRPRTQNVSGRNVRRNRGNWRQSKIFMATGTGSKDRSRSAATSRRGCYLVERLACLPSCASIPSIFAGVKGRDHQERKQNVRKTPLTEHSKPVIIAALGICTSFSHKWDLDTLPLRLENAFKQKNPTPIHEFPARSCKSSLSEGSVLPRNWPTLAKNLSVKVRLNSKTRRQTERRPLLRQTVRRQVHAGSTDRSKEK